MIIIKNTRLVSIITFGFAFGITLYPFILFKGEPTKYDINHEKIHLQQQKELLVIGFYIWYFIEWCFKGYRNISFEKEAYDNESNLDYLSHRKIWNIK
jgi:hypothetical protein